MDLIERYLDAVRFFLSRAQRDDILDELRDLLMTRREAREAELGRPLNRMEDEALLQAFGHPLAVAARYGAQQYLIGPELYPIYAFVVKVVLACVALGAVIAGIVGAAIGGLGHGVGVTMSVIWTGLFVSVGAVTVVFATAQRTGAGRRMLSRWSVADLPSLTRRRRRKSQPQWYENVAGIVVQTIFILWWVGLIQLWRPDIPVTGGGTLHFAFAPALQVLYYPVLAAAAGAIAVNGLKLASETRPIGHVLDMMVQVALVALAGYALHTTPQVLVTGVGLPPLVAAKVAYGVGIGAEVTLIVIICSAVLSLGLDGWRLFRALPTTRRATNGA
ncbi:MAG TPA: hypothetical protein VHW60_06100 [Caulobacteraceae bacterium]|nr:hypothetical protein [Caulobacteraceae bacterium]